MKKTAYISTIILLLAIVGLVSCKPNYEKIFAENNEKFDKNKTVLNKTVQTIEKSSEELFSTLAEAKISTDGLFINADSGFDSKDFRSICEKWGVVPNVAFNYRNGENKDELLLDDLLYKAH